MYVWILHNISFQIFLRSLKYYNSYSVNKESRMQQQQKQLGSTYSSTGANFSTVGNSATKSPNSSIDRKVTKSNTKHCDNNSNWY